jgi:pantothenate kinase
VDIDDAVREERLVRRHQQFGRSAEEARAWVASTDAPNARLIAATRVRAHHVLPWS